MVDNSPSLLRKCIGLDSAVDNVDRLGSPNKTLVQRILE